MSNATGNFSSEDFEQPIKELESKIEELEQLQADSGGQLQLDTEIEALRQRLAAVTKDIFSNMTAWQRITIARRPDRPVTSDYVSLITTNFMELHGDRCFSDDRAIISGLAQVGKHRVLLVGTQKGKNTRERTQCNWGCPHPEGYRKAIHKMQLAERFGLPIVTLIDTTGAYPGIGAEERGQAQAIAYNLRAMSTLRVPILCVIIGEGGSGGAIGIGLGDKFLMMENSWFSVISPEGCAAILWKTADKRKEAAEALKLTAKDLLRLGIIDQIIPEPAGGAHRDIAAAASAVKEAIVGGLDELRKVPLDELLNVRYQKYRRVGAFLSGDVS